MNDMDTDAVLRELDRLERDIAACRWWQRRKRRQLEVTWAAHARMALDGLGWWPLRAARGHRSI